MGISKVYFPDDAKLLRMTIKTNKASLGVFKQQKWVSGKITQS
ncbi:hypothetical protein [Listeria aquatica]|nr:hypothetical protein [Listeria aquatica]